MRTNTSRIEVHTHRYELHVGNICAFREKQKIDILLKRVLDDISLLFISLYILIDIYLG